MVTLIEVGGWLFWAIVACVVAIEVLLLSLSDNDGPADSPGPVTIALIGLVGVVFFTDAFHGVSLGWIIPCSVTYAFAGLAWSVKKWWDFVVDAKKRHFSKPPSARDNKQLIVTWMTLWPFSFTWWVLTWPRRFFSWIYERISTSFDRLAAYIWSRAQ